MIPKKMTNPFCVAAFTLIVIPQLPISQEIRNSLPDLRRQVCPTQAGGNRTRMAENQT